MYLPDSMSEYYDHLFFRMSPYYCICTPTKQRGFTKTFYDNYVAQKGCTPETSLKLRKEAI